MYLGSEAMLGIAWGLFQAITLPYVFDITPFALKGPASILINVYWLWGQVVCSGVLRASLEVADAMWEIRLPMLWQYTWLWLLALIVYRAPESPMWLIRSDRSGDAARVLSRMNRDPRFDPDDHVAMLEALNEHERESSLGMGFRTCFSSQNLRRTEIAVVVYAAQQMVGTPLVSYSVKLLDKGGLGTAHAYIFNICMWFCCICSSFAAMFALRKLGRRTMWLGGATMSCALHLASGLLAVLPDTSIGILSYVIAAILITFALTYNFTLGPIGYTIVAEIPASRLKTATNSLARGAFILVNLANLWLVPKLLEDRPLGWGLGAKTSLLYAGLSALCVYWGKSRLPETANLSPAQIDHLFAQLQRPKVCSAAGEAESAKGQ